MKKFRPLAIALCAVLLLVSTVLGTVAYLTDSADVVNTFTVGNVDLTLDEAKVNEDGTPVDPAERTENGNNYHLVPGMTYTKDPTTTVKKGSEESYVRMILTINCSKELDAIFAPQANLIEIFKGYNPAIWNYQGVVRDANANTVSYEFRYCETVNAKNADVKLEPLFTSFTVPGEITGPQLKTIEDLEMTVEAHAIQAAGFSTAKAAWEAFTKN